MDNIPPSNSNLNETVSSATPAPVTLQEVTTEPSIISSNPPAPLPKRSILKPFLAILIILLTIGLSIGGWWGYQKIYLSPDRVLLQAVAKIPQMKTYEYSASATLRFAFDLQTLLSNLSESSLKAEFLGMSDLNSESHSLTISVSEGSQKYGSLAIRAFKEGIYFNLAKDPGQDIDYLNLDNFLNTWFQIDVEKLKEFSYTKNYVPDNLGISAEQKQILADNFINNPPLRITETLSSEKINGQQMFHYKYQIDKENFKKLISDLQKSYINSESAEEVYKQMLDQEFSRLEFLPGEIWIGKKDKFLHKITFETTYKTGSSSSSLSLVLQINNIDGQVTIEKPVNFKTWDDLMTLLGLNVEQQFSQSRDTQRRADLYAITNSIYQFSAEHNGNLPDTDGVDTRSTFPTKETCIGTSPDCFNLAGAGSKLSNDSIVPTYIAVMPMDPKNGTQENTSYTIYQDTNGRIVAKAIGEESPEIKVTR